MGPIWGRQDPCWPRELYYLGTWPSYGQWKTALDAVVTKTADLKRSVSRTPPRLAQIDPCVIRVDIGPLLKCEIHGPLTRYAQLRVAHAPGMPGTFSPSPRVNDPDMHHDTCVTHVPWCMTGSLTSGFLWRRWRGKRSRHSRRMHNPQFYVSGKRSIAGKSSRPWHIVISHMWYWFYHRHESGTSEEWNHTTFNWQKLS